MIKVRRGELRDWADIKRLMIDFANFNPVEDLRAPKYSEAHTDSVLQHIMTYGVMLVAEEHNRVVGMLLATIQGDLWLPNIKRMTEVAWWVEESYRGTTAGARLLKEYIGIGIELQDEDLITSFTLTTLSTTPDLQLNKRGWEAVDYNWVWRG